MNLIRLAIVGKLLKIDLRKLEGWRGYKISNKPISLYWIMLSTLQFKTMYLDIYK